MDGLRQYPAYVTFAVAAALYVVNITPVIGDLTTFVLLPFAAPILMTLGMFRLLMEGAIGGSSRAILLVPLAYFGLGAYLFASDFSEIKALRQETAAFAASQPHFAPPERLRKVTILGCGQVERTTLGTMLGVEIDYVQPERPSGAPAAQGESNTQVPEDDGGWARDDDASEAPVASDWAGSPANDSTGSGRLWGNSPAGPRIGVTVECEDMPDFGGSGEAATKFIVSHNGRETAFISDYREISSGIMFPLIARGPLGGGGTSEVQWQVTMEHAMWIDPDGLSPTERIARILRPSGP